MSRFLILPLVALTACTVAVNSDYPPAQPLDAAYTSCEVPEDCVIVSLGCCDACNGGVEVSVNTASADEVSERFSETCPANTACTEMGCAERFPTCDAGVCGLQQGQL